METKRAGTVKRTGHWIARLPGPGPHNYLQRRSSRPTLVWDVRANASSFLTRKATEEAVRQSGYRGPLPDVTIERIAMTHSDFSEWRREVHNETTAV